MLKVIFITHFSFFRIGSVILALHDASDVFMEAAKVFKYSGKELAASVFFGLFSLSWFFLRLIVFPFWVIRASRFVPSIDVLISLISGCISIILLNFLWFFFYSHDIQHFMDLSEAYPMRLYYVFNIMLLTLLVFHIYWWILICSMIMRQLKNRGQVGEDIRSGEHFLFPYLVWSTFRKK